MFEGVIRDHKVGDSVAYVNSRGIDLDPLSRCGVPGRRIWIDANASRCWESCQKIASAAAEIHNAHAITCESRELVPIENRSRRADACLPGEVCAARFTGVAVA